MAERLPSLKSDELSALLPYLSEGFCNICKDLLEARLCNLSSDSKGKSAGPSHGQHSGFCSAESASLSLNGRGPIFSPPSVTSKANSGIRPDSIVVPLPELSNLSLNGKERIKQVIPASVHISEQSEFAKMSQVRRKKDFRHMERVNGRNINVLQGLELHTRVFTEEEQQKIVDYVYDLQRQGRSGQLKERTYTEPEKWMRGKGRVTIQFGCCYNLMGLCIAVVALVITVRQYLIRKSTVNNPGSVADLVKRGQLRSDRRGMSRPLKYDDPFNNPLVKVSKTNSTVEMCGKVYRLAPVTLTEDEQSSHQKRRSRAYQWKRPTIFLKEGESIPPDVDPDTVRWIPANHPFATTISDIDEELAQNNVYQKRGVPFRIKAEHEALQKKLEALQNEQKLNKIEIDPSIARDFERPFKSLSTSNENVQERSSATQGGNSTSPVSDRVPRSSETNT